MNVCRSPLMQWAFIDNLLRSGLADFNGSSRGVQAARGNTICREGTILMQDCEAGLGFAHRHASARLTRSDLDESHLVIVATLAHRALLARYAPALRSRTFTLREANLLAAEAATTVELAELAREEERLGARLALLGFPSMLHRRRGTVRIPPPSGWRRRLDPLDIPDAHLKRISAHRATLLSVDSETRTLASCFTAFAEKVNTP